MGHFCVIPKYLTRNFLSEIMEVGYLVIAFFHGASVFSLLSFNLLHLLSLYLLPVLRLTYLCYLLFIMMSTHRSFFLIFPWNCLMLNELQKRRVHQVTRNPGLFRWLLWPMQACKPHVKREVHVPKHRHPLPLRFLAGVFASSTVAESCRSYVIFAS